MTLVVTADLSLTSVHPHLHATSNVHPQVAQGHGKSVSPTCTCAIQSISGQPIDRETEVHALGQDAMSAAGELAQLQLHKLQVCIKLYTSLTSQM
jgi:hypothetical protein